MLLQLDSRQTVIVVYICRGCTDVRQDFSVQVKYSDSMAAAGLHRLSSALSLNRQVLIHGLARLQPATNRYTTRIPRTAFHVRAGATKGKADDFLAKIHDSDLVKTAGFINGQWVPANDGSTIEASPTYSRSDVCWTDKRAVLHQALA